MTDRAEPGVTPHRLIRDLQKAECTCGYRGTGTNWDRAEDDVVRHIIATLDAATPRPGLVEALTELENEASRLRADPERPPYYANGIEHAVQAIRAALLAPGEVLLYGDGRDPGLQTDVPGFRHHPAPPSKEPTDE